MKKITLGILITLTILAVSGVAGAAWHIPLLDSATKNAKVSDKSPAIKITENSLTLTPPGLERIVYIHYKKGFAKPPWARGGKKQSSCFDFLGRGAKWKELPISYVVHPEVEATVPEAIFTSAKTWDRAVPSKELFSDSYTEDPTASWDGDAPDGRNELVFGDYPEEGVIAVTVVWGYFSGPPSTRKIVEFDVMFDTEYVWGDADPDNDEIVDNPEVMDLQNIATHEIGHGIGLADVYEDGCKEVTMYGYSNYGEIKKRSLETPDIKGVQELYE